VEVIVQLPVPISSQDFKLYSGAYGASGNDANVESQLSNDGKTIALRTKELKLAYNDYYYETMAQGITLQLAFENDVFQSYAQTRVFTKQMLWITIGGLLVLALACWVRFAFRKKPDLISVVNIKAPDEMDPLQMGKLLDGIVDQEDITSMIYYFAQKGYLSIDLENEDDPVLVKKVQNLDQSVPHHQKTLFNGLFLKGDLKRRRNPIPT
jgi:hypothetical protein